MSRETGKHLMLNYLNILIDWSKFIQRLGVDFKKSSFVTNSSNEERLALISKSVIITLMVTLALFITIIINIITIYGSLECKETWQETKYRKDDPTIETEEKVWEIKWKSVRATLQISKNNRANFKNLVIWTKKIYRTKSPDWLNNQN